jgi:hypothetical protein
MNLLRMLRADRGWFVPDCRAGSYLSGPQADSLLARLSLKDVDRKQVSRFR